MKASNKINTSFPTAWGLVLYPLITLILVASASGCATRRSNFKASEQLIKTIDQRLADAASQYRYFMTKIPADRFPKSVEIGKLTTSGSDWWCSGFYPGTLLYLSVATGDTVLKLEALRRMKLLEKEQFNRGTHDLGFMMFCSFGNANRYDPKPEYRSILINSARSLSTRFDEKVGSIRSWNSKSNDYLVIIDNMMNLELLFWAARETGENRFREIAITHAQNTISDHFRPDYSTYHVVNYDPRTGQPQRKHTAQGAADESAWARGQAWGLYGFTLMYRETKNKLYLQQANRISDFLLDHPRLPKDKIPYWDFDAPGIPNSLRDASAAAIMASALIELSGYNQGKTAQRQMGTAETILETLSQGTYFAEKSTNEGFILKHSVGHMPNKTEVDVPLTYADYYYIEAIMRYRQRATESDFLSAY